MSTAGNILWFILIGWWLGSFYGILCLIVWPFAWLLSTVTRSKIWINWQRACWRLDSYMYFPFGSDLIPAKMLGEELSSGEVVVNTVWMFTVGWIGCTACYISGGVCCLSIIGIPFGLAWFRLGSAMLSPLGTRRVPKDVGLAARARFAQGKLDALSKH